jgi:hypothetical protein
MLARVRDDPGRWTEFADWLAQQRPRLDAVTIERILLHASSLPIDSDAVARLAVSILGHIPPVDAEYSRFFATVLSRPTDRAALDYASALLEVARPRFPDDQDLDLASARLNAGKSEWKAACRLFEHYVGALGPDDLALYLTAASYSRDPDHMSEAIRRLDSTVGSVNTLGELRRFTAALALGIELRHEVGEPLDDPLEALLQQVISVDERAAYANFDTWVTQFSLRVESRLRLLTSFETLEDPGVVGNVLEHSYDVAREALAGASRERAHEAIGLVEFFERATATTAERSSVLRSDFRDKWPEDDSTVDAVSLPTFAGRVITVAGGAPGVRSRILESLAALDANIREIPPSWEERLDLDVVAKRTKGAHYVALLTDVVGHDMQSILRQVAGRPGQTFELVPTQGGPSRVIRELGQRILAA